MSLQDVLGSMPPAYKAKLISLSKEGGKASYVERGDCGPG